MQLLEEAITKLDELKPVLADYEARAAAADAGSPTPAEEFSSQVVTNADGSVIVTLTPTAPAPVSEEPPATVGDTGPSSESGTGEPGPTGPTPTGQ